VPRRSEPRPSGSGSAGQPRRCLPCSAPRVVLPYANATTASIVCPNGAAPSSPGLPRSGYPGTVDAHATFNPNGVAPSSPGLGRSRYPGTVDAHATFNPNGVAPSSPGLGRSRCPGTVDAHATFNPNGVAPSSPGLGRSRYPGTVDAHATFNPNGVAALDGTRRNPFRVECLIDPLSQGSRCAATLGWRT
jgi:hypothetical protein